VLARSLSACQTDGATDANGTPRVRASLSAHQACSCAKSSAPSFALRVAKFDACASCASSRCDGAHPYRAFSSREAWKIEIDFDSDSVRSKNSGLCRA
jgi:hypothetical protein